MSKTEVLAVDGDGEFEEEDSEVVENDFILLHRGWWWSLNGDDGYGGSGRRIERLSS